MLISFYSKPLNTEQLCIIQLLRGIKLCWICPASVTTAWGCFLHSIYKPYISVGLWHMKCISIYCFIQLTLNAKTVKSCIHHRKYFDLKSWFLPSLSCFHCNLLMNFLITPNFNQVSPNYTITKVWINRIKRASFMEVDVIWSASSPLDHWQFFLLFAFIGDNFAFAFISFPY